MGGWWVQRFYEISPVLLGCWVFWIIGSIVLHELGHGWAAVRQGDTTPIDTGHMTYNPVVHMGLHGLVMFAAIGIAYGFMPVDPSRFRSKHGDAFVSAAGPAVNLVLAVACFVCLCVWVPGADGYWVKSWDVPGHVYRNFRVFFLVGASLNLVLLAFNLLPVPPLDGSRILASFVPAYERLVQDPRAQGPALVVFILIFIFGGQVLFGAAFQAVTTGLDAVVGVIAPGYVTLTGP